MKSTKVRILRDGDNMGKKYNKDEIWELLYEIDETLIRVVKDGVEISVWTNSLVHPAEAEFITDEIVNEYDIW